MADGKPQSRQQAESEASPSPKDYYSVLMKVIGDASRDPSQLRNLVYALARHNLRPTRPDTPTELALALELEKAIERVEADTVLSPVARPAEDQPATSNSLATVAETLDRPERSDRTHLTSVPSWLELSIPRTIDTIDYVPAGTRPARSTRFTAIVQLIAASVIGVDLYVGMTTWIYWSRQPAPTAAALAQPATVPAEIDTKAQQAPTPEPQPVLPFPLPRSYGVFAGTNGQLVALEQLPIKVPINRVQVSAEITQPSKATVAGDKLAFIVYRRDLVASAPQSVSVRVVARVTRAMQFIDGKPTVTPIESSWRIRDKSYEFQVSPLEGNREMVLIQPDPDFVFSPGRYALVLNGYGYDFTVTGEVTAPEQCLEQVQVKDGIVVTECPKKS